VSDASATTSVEIGLSAAILAIDRMEPRIVTIATGSDAAGGGDGVDVRPLLPLGPFDPVAHRTFEVGLRAFVAEQTGLDLGYVEQLYTFGDRGRHKRQSDTHPHIVSVGYLALTRLSETIPADRDARGMQWSGWYGFLPWEDWRDGRPSVLDADVLPRLRDWVGQGDDTAGASWLPDRAARLRLAFGLDDFPWDEERVLERYELLYEAGLLAESVADGRRPADATAPPLGRAMRFDHRRILATALARLRGKIKYRPVIFELMPPSFTLTELQTTVEAISGRHLHKQNFRRLIEGAELVEPTGQTAAPTGGRPAALYRFRRKIFQERPAPGIRVASMRSAGRS
jgi:hypothetical protein